MTPIIGVDIDGCVYDWASAAVVTLLEQGYDEAPHPDDWNGWYALQEAVPEEAWTWLWRDGLRSMFERGDPYPQSVEALRFLKGRARLAFLTNRPRRIADVTLAWLAEHRFQPYAVVHVEDSKADLFDCVAYIEDRPSNVAELACTGAKVFVPVRPWNRDSSALRLPRVQPFENWQDIIAWAKDEL